MQVKRKARFPTGVDEAGRGAWAGPVFAGAFRVLRPSAIDSAWYARVTDSKLLSPARREALREAFFLARSAGDVDFAIGSASAEEIDALGIKEANRTAMVRALAELGSRVDLSASEILVDGNDGYAFPEVPGKLAVRCIVRGDLTERAIGAASILAKTARDEYMRALAGPGMPFDFSRHKGYGTALHRHELSLSAPTCQHRRSFAPMKNLQSAPETLYFCQ